MRAVAWAFEVDGELGADASGVGREHEDAIGEQDGFFDVVGDDEHGAGGEVVACPEREELGAEVFGGEHVERGERFVHEEGVGFDDEGAGEADALAHAAGELFGVGGLEAVEADEVDGVFGAVAAFGGGHVAGFEAELDVLADGEPRQQREGLEHHRDAGVGGGDAARPCRARGRSVGAMRPARQRSRVDLPEPDLPRSATISPSWSSKLMSSSTGRGAPSGVVNDLVMWSAARIVVRSVCALVIASTSFPRAGRAAARRGG